MVKIYTKFFLFCYHYCCLLTLFTTSQGTISVFGKNLYSFKANQVTSTSFIFSWVFSIASLRGQIRGVHTSGHMKSFIWTIDRTNFFYSIVNKWIPTSSSYHRNEGHYWMSSEERFHRFQKRFLLHEGDIGIYLNSNVAMYFIELTPDTYSCLSIFSDMLCPKIWKKL